MSKKEHTKPGGAFAPPFGTNVGIKLLQGGFVMKGNVIMSNDNSLLTVKKSEIQAT